MGFLVIDRTMSDKDNISRVSLKKAGAPFFMIQFINILLFLLPIEK